MVHARHGEFYVFLSAPLCDGGLDFTVSRWPNLFGQDRNGVFKAGIGVGNGVMAASDGSGER
jgi:hypothetical protein